MVWKHKDSYCRSVLSVPSQSSTGSIPPARVRAEDNSEILAQLFPIMYKRQLLLKVNKLKNIIEMGLV